MKLPRLKVLSTKDKNARFVVFDKTLKKEFGEIFRGERLVHVDPRFESEVFVDALSLAILRYLGSRRLESLTYYYFLEVLRRVKPSCVLTGTHLSSTFYLVRKNYQTPRCRFVVFQTTLWADTSPRMLVPPVNNALQPGDQVFCLTEAYSLAWKNLAPRSEVIPAGSLASKLQPSSDRNEAGGGRVAWISVWRNATTVYGATGLTMEEAYSLERSMLPRLLNILGAAGLELEIVPSRKSPEWGEERRFYDSILPSNDWKFLARAEDESIFTHLDGYDLIFGSGSTLLYEALSRLKRTMFLSNKEVSKLRHPFGFPDHERLYNHPLHLVEENSANWRAQIDSVLRLPQDEFYNLAAEVVGESILLSTASTVLENINSHMEID